MKNLFISKYLFHPLIILFVVFFFLPWFFPFLGGYIYLATEIMIWVIFALGFNLVLGRAGLPSFGHGAFYGMGAYAFGLVQKSLFPGLWLPLLMGTLFGGVGAAIFGFFLSRKRGIYLALLSVAFTELCYFVAFRWDEVTGGEDGLTGISRVPVKIPGVFSIDMVDPVNFYFFVYILFVVCILLIWVIYHSPFGRVLEAIKQNENRARCLGYNTTFYVWVVLVISGLFGGLSGSLSALLSGGAYYSPMHWTQSGNVVIMSLLGGGPTNFFGPVLGAIIFIVLRDITSTITEHWMLIYGLLFVFVIAFMPEGILGVLGKKAKKTGMKNPIVQKKIQPEKEITE